MNTMLDIQERLDFRNRVGLRFNLMMQTPLIMSNSPEISLQTLRD